MRSCCFLFLLLLATPLYAIALERVQIKTDSHQYLEGGVLLGSETKIHSHVESPIRVFVETGIALRPINAAKNNLGLSIGMSSGIEDLRCYLAPVYSRKLSGNWRVEASGGVLWSSHDSPWSSDFFEWGQHWRLALKRNNRFSLCYVYERMDYLIDGGPHSGTSGSLNSSFLGISMETEPPVLISVAVAAAILTYWFKESITHWVVVAK